MKLLTKSRFKLGLECPNKLFYTGKKQYADSKVHDPFLQALAQGGFQVEALARAAYPHGHFVNAAHYEYAEAVAETEMLLAKNDTVIFEAAFSSEDLFVRTDIVEKIGNTIRLIEVKAKSFRSADENVFVGKKGALTSEWKMYLFDLAFQKYVAQAAFPQYRFEAYLCLADKDKTTEINGLNQMFRVLKNGDPRRDIVPHQLSADQLQKADVLTQVNVDDIINDILNNKHTYFPHRNFAETVDFMAQHYKTDQYADWPVNYASCKGCEFKADDIQRAAGLSCGFSECFSKQKGWKLEDILKPTIFEIWNFPGAAKLAQHDRWFMDDLVIDDFKTGASPDRLATGDRQWLQVSKKVSGDTSIYVEKEGLTQQMDQWIFPLHFIDFETSAVALPFTSGKRPYEQVAFQFSHHIYHADGKIEHHSQYINGNPGEFPNFEFVRMLKKSLDADNGTIFRYSNHENTILNVIMQQLSTSNEPDRNVLIAFIRTVTVSPAGHAQPWQGNRAMVDLCKVIKDYYYNPYTNGSNSIKHVLPAILKASTYLQHKYSKSLYEAGVSSLNFNKSHIWLKKAAGQVLSPYKMLPPLFEGWNENMLNSTVSQMEDIADGGAALTAYAKLQYVDMSAQERDEISAALLKYCELDTLAMVMVYEHLRFDL